MSGRRTPQELSRLQIAALVLTACGAVLASVAGARSTEGRAGIFFVRHVAGDVLFDHTAHSDRSAECATCHHTLWESAAQDACESCHGDDVDASMLEHDDYVELHDSGCSTCHTKADDETAGSCRDCHPAAQTESQVTGECMDCHDFDRDEAQLEHDALIELHDDCEVCHAPRAISSAYHEQCIACHTTTDPERFRNDDGTSACGWCHLQ